MLWNRNSWRDWYNPLRGLSIVWLVAMEGAAKRGPPADLQWLYAARLLTSRECARLMGDRRLPHHRHPESGPPRVWRRRLRARHSLDRRDRAEYTVFQKAFRESASVQF